VPTPEGKAFAGETEKKTMKIEKRIAEIIRKLENGAKSPEFRKIPTKRHPKTPALDPDDASIHDVGEVVKCCDTKSLESNLAATSDNGIEKLDHSQQANSDDKMDEREEGKVNDRGVDKEVNNVALRSDDMRPPEHGEEELSSPRSQSDLENREAPPTPMLFASEPPPPPPTTPPLRRHGRRRTIVKVVSDAATTSTDVHDFDKPQQEDEDSISIKTDCATRKGRPPPTYHWSGPPPPTMSFYLSQPPPPPPPRRAPRVTVKPERDTEKAVGSEEPHHKPPETKYSSIKTVTKKRQKQQKSISGVSQFPPPPLACGGRHMDVKTDHATMKTNRRKGKSVRAPKLSASPFDDRNDTFAGREEICPIARIRLNSKRTQLV
jgi:hypothetical protein